jgi:hypothetical protein
MTLYSGFIPWHLKIWNHGSTADYLSDDLELMPVALR